LFTIFVYFCFVVTYYMHILQNTFDQLSIPANESVVMIDQFWHGAGSKTISVGEWASLTYLIVIKEQVSLDLRIESSGTGAQILVKWLLLGKEWSDIKLTAHAHLMQDNTSADLHLVSMLQDGSVCEVDGWVDLHEWCHKISGHLLEENIVLWSDIQIKTLPMLDVRSSDVSASHGCRIQKLDDKKLFYMRSKGLSKQQAEELMIKGYFDQLFAAVKWDEDSNQVVEKLEKEYIDYLLG